MRSIRSVVIAASLVAGVAVVSPAPGQASADGTTLVISEVYGAGGIPGAAYNADFVELYNPTGHTLPLDGLSVHFRSAIGRFNAQPFALHGSLPAHRHYLIRMSGVHSTGDRLPTPDAIADPHLGMAARGGQVLLLIGTEPVTGSGDMVGNGKVVDMVGLGAAKSFETAPGPNTSAARSANRTAAGADTDDNSADLHLAAPSPRNLASDDAPAVVSSVADERVRVRTGTTTLHARVVGTPTPTGSLDVYVAGHLTTTVPLDADGRASVPVGPFPRAGTVRVTASYTGDADHPGSDAEPLVITVVKATPTLTVSHSPDRIVVHRTRPKVTVKLSSSGVFVHGKVRFESGGRHWLRTVNQQQASVTLPSFHTVGRHKVTITYLGSGVVSRATTSTRLLVVR